MAVFRFNITVKVNENEDVYLETNHPSHGTASYTLIDVPGNNDMETTNENKILLGKGKDLFQERTIVFSKVVNMDVNNSDVKFNLLINSNEIVVHSNPKNIDASPQIKVNLNFIMS